MSGHAEMRHVKGVDMSTGSLGQGISVAVGMALAGKADGRDYRVYALLGDGEIEEGQVWGGRHGGGQVPPGQPVRRGGCQRPADRRRHGGRDALRAAGSEV